MQRVAAAGVIALVAAGLAILVWAFFQLQGRYGPSYGARLPDGRIVLASHGHLHVFDADKRIARIAFKELGLGAMVTDLDALADGALLVADADSRALRRCRLAERSCTLVYDGTAYPDGALRKAFKAAVEPSTGRVVVSDSSNHRLLLLDAKGALRSSTPKNGPLFTFPNGIAFLADGSVAVADTDHRRIAFVTLANDTLVVGGKDLRMRQVFPGTDVLFPIDVIGDARGRLWSILANNSLESGAVVSLQADGGKASYAPLPSPADPLSLVPLDDAMLVLEPTTFRVTRIALADGASTPFADRAFQDELRAEAAWRTRLLRIREAAQALLVLAVLAAIAIAVRARVMRVAPQVLPRWKIPEAAAPLAGGVDWISANPLPGRAVLYGLMAVAVLAALGSYVSLESAAKGSEAEWLRLQLTIGALCLMVVLVVIGVQRLSRGRIGTDGETLFVEDAGRKLQAPLAEVLYSNRRLLVGPGVVPLRLPGGDRYPSERVASSILARLPASARVSEWRLDMAYISRWWRRLTGRLRRPT